MTGFSPLSLDLPDGLALAVLILTWALTGWLVEHPPRSRPSVSMLMAEYRRDWMRQFVTRTPRIFDANIIDSLRQSTAFFASASMIAIGGGVALIGNVTQLEGLAHELTLDAAGVRVELKIILVLMFLANALLKFVWAHRLFGYCAILMAAVPNEAQDPLVYVRAGQAAEINVTAAKSFNRGLMSIYFALAATSWLLGPWVLIGATLVTCIVLLRREFASASRLVMLAR
ncbi:MAG: DUF599 domain-containing protein [Cypionkella sp.]|nr:DUF599 domain-containing protein [Cypionkella sp.]